MQFKQSAKWVALLALGVATVTSAQASQSHQRQFYVVPSCLLKNISAPVNALAQMDDLNLISMAAEDEGVIIAAKDKDKACGGFFNVSDEWLKHQQGQQFKPQFSKQFLSSFKMSSVPGALVESNHQIQHQALVNELNKTIEPNNIWSTLESLTAFSDRSASSKTGEEAASWLKDQFDSYAKTYGRSDVDSYFVDSGWWYRQPSVVTVIGKDLPGTAVVLGAHMDTLSNNMPGADDDGSGSATLMEVARVLLASKEKLTHPVYILWYAAEERGLVGSAHVVDDFIEKNIPVKSVLQFDMVGYRYNGDDTIWMITDNTNSSLTDYVAGLIENYTGVKVDYTRCGYACSDHASWTRKGFQSAFPFEAKFGQEDPYIHTHNDTMDAVSLEHMTNFAKVGVAFAVELAS